MSRVGKNAVTYIVTAICIATAINLMTPLSLAQSAGTLITNASYSPAVGASGWYTTAPVVTLTATDEGGPGVAHTYYRMNGSSLILYSSPFTMPEGITNLLFYSNDTTGKTETIINGQNNVSIKVDTVKPTINITIKGTTTGGVYNGTTTMNLTSKDSGSGVALIQYSINDESHWTNFTTNVTLPDLSKIYYRAIDTAGNINESWLTITVFNPDVGTSPDSGWTTDGSDVTVVFTTPPGTSDVDHFDFSLDGKTWYHSTDVNHYPIVINWEGNQTLYYKAVSATGVFTNIKKAWFGVDKWGPIISVTLEGDKDKSKGWFNGNINVHFNPQDGGGISLTQYSWDQKNWNTVPANNILTVGRGTSRTIYFRTYDMGGRGTPIGSQFLYFAPGSSNQGGMSNQVNINGTLSGGDTSGTASASPTPSEGPMPTPTQQPIPTPTIVPSPEPSNTPAPAAGSPLAIAVLVGVLVLLGIVAAAAYLFVFKPK